MKQPMKTKQTCVIYACISPKTNHVDAASFACELAAIADERGYTFARLPFIEPTSDVKRPILSECLQYCEAHHVDTLIVPELSCLGRSASEMLETVKRLTGAGVNIYFRKENFSTLNEEGAIGSMLPLFISVNAAVAQMEREAPRLPYATNSK